jgi:predicted AAA+ superfamily ATPase
MNTIYSPGEYFHRWLTPLLQSAAHDQPVVVLTGARQVGKSTTVRNEEPFCDWPYRTLDDLDLLGRARTRPEDLWAGTDRVVIDEVQRAPELLLAVKRAVDENPGRRFVLTGSANLLMMSRVAESLAGRAVYVEMLPMSLGESLHRPPPSVLEDALAGVLPNEGKLPNGPRDPWPLILRGFLPPLLRLDSSVAAVRWWEGYVATYLERDLRQLSQIESLPDFRHLMQALALRSGQLLNLSETARDVGLSQPTAHRYTRLLEVSGLFHAVPAFARNRTKRLMKSPKALWTDPGLACFLAGIHDAATLMESREAGRLFETLVWLHLGILAQRMTPRPTLHHWRTATGVEVDFVVEHGRRLLPIEVKSTTRPGYDDAKGVEAFLAEYPEAKVGLVIHAGDEVRRLGERVAAVPWWVLAGG